MSEKTLKVILTDKEGRTKLDGLLLESCALANFETILNSMEVGEKIIFQKESDNATELKT